MAILKSSMAKILFASYLLTTAFGSLFAVPCRNEADHAPISLIDHCDVQTIILTEEYFASSSEKNNDCEHCIDCTNGLTELATGKFKKKRQSPILLLHDNSASKLNSIVENHLLNLNSFPVGISDPRFRRTTVLVI